jgi:hypothetical protein
VIDDDFVRAFLEGSLPPTQFHHRDHLRLAWCLTRQLGVAAATRTITSGIRRFAAEHGQADKYHETLTQFWVRIVGHLIDARPDIAEFARFLTTFPQVLNKDLPYRHWRRETMGSLSARVQWVEPDLLALPA